MQEIKAELQVFVSTSICIEVERIYIEKENKSMQGYPCKSYMLCICKR